MRLNCPNCGEHVTAENINIQKMTAVCAACDTVFPFELPEAKAKAKWRDVRQPEKLVLRDAETLRMEFATNFRLDRNETFILGTVGGSVMSVVGLSLIGELGVPIFLPIGFLLIAAALFYWAALTVLNRTHIEMDADTITVKRRPFPNPLQQKFEIPLDGVTAIKYEETPTSKKEGFDTPRYRVWAEMTDGFRRTIVNDVIEDYAVYIAQTLEERLYADSNADVSRLEDDDRHLDEVADFDEILRESRNSVRR
jgi:hypothetical protein